MERLRPRGRRNELDNVDNVNNELEHVDNVNEHEHVNDRTVTGGSGNDAHA